MKKKLKMVCIFCNLALLALVLRLVYIAAVLEPGAKADFREIGLYLITGIFLIVTRVEALKKLDDK